MSRNINGISVTLRAANRWIPVSEGLPERETLCLIRTTEPEIHLARMGTDRWWESPNRVGRYFDFEEVTHWSKVEPPEEE